MSINQKIDELICLSEKLDNNLITQQEYEDYKADLLNEIDKKENRWSLNFCLLSTFKEKCLNLLNSINGYMKSEKTASEI